MQRQNDSRSRKKLTILHTFAKGKLPTLFGKEGKAGLRAGHTRISETQNFGGGTPAMGACLGRKINNSWKSETKEGGEGA